MNKPELEAKLHNYEERLKDIAKAIKETRDQLSELEKPKLRHGDFGINEEGNPRITLFHHGSDGGKREDSCLFGMCIDSDYPILGNIFDLLKEWSADLAEVKVGCCDDKLEYHLKATLESNGNFRIGTQTDTIVISVKQTEKYWLYLGRMLATQKRKENKCS